MSSRLIRARAGWEWFEMGSWNLISQHAMVPLLVPAEKAVVTLTCEGCKTSDKLDWSHGLGLTQTQPALVHVHTEGRDEAQTQVVTQRPGVGVGAEVPANQRAVHCGVGQDGLSPGVKVIDVHSTTVQLEVQTPEDVGHAPNIDKSFI